ncbi:MAG: hypothetical protein ACRDPD_19885, partial [Streptosporangiaceae bacterium]
MPSPRSAIRWWEPLLIPGLLQTGRGPVGAQPPLGVPPRLPLLPGRDGCQPQSGGEHGADVRQAARRRADGRVPEPGGGHPVPGQPAPPRPRAEQAGGHVPVTTPPGFDLGRPPRPGAQRDRQQVKRGTVMLPAQHEPVDVALGQPDHPGVRAPRR